MATTMDTLETSDVAPAVEGQRKGDRIGRIDLRSTWQVGLGALFAVLGLVIILFAWYGAAHTSYVQQQIPYMVSGSFIGLGLMVVGGLLYFSHWVYRVYDQADLHHTAALERQEELIGRLIAAVERGAPGAGVTDPTAGLAAERLVVTATGTSVHRPDCAIVARHPEGVRAVSAAEAADLPRCRICNP